MCTVKELKEFLNTLPDDAIVEVLKEEIKGYSTYTSFVDLDISEYSDNCDVYDFTSSEYLNSNCYGKVYINLGGR